MSRAAQKLIAASGGKAYEIEQSLMFDRASGSYLERTPSSAGNRRTWTLSAWVKPSIAAAKSIFSAHDASTETNAGWTWIGINASSQLQVGGWSTNWRVTNRLFRDVSAWYHIFVVVDTTQGTAGDRVKVYVNGVEETSFATSNNPSENEELAINSGIEHQIGAVNYSNRNYWDGYIAEAYLIDGTAKAASDFGETDSETEQWIPKKYTGGSYGTNGFYMPWKKNDRYSVYFDGSTSTGLQTADSSDFTLGTNNFTIEAWIYVDEDAGVTRKFAGQSPTSGADADSSITLRVNSSNKAEMLVFYSGGNLTLTSSTSISNNKWYHVAGVRNGTGFALYLDGTSEDTATSSETVTDSGYKFGVGLLGESTSNTFKGWISNFRLVNGTAVYTSNFTPSTSPLTAITNTKLLCCQDSTITTDNSGTSKTITVINTANTYSQQMAPFQFDWYQDQSGQDNDYQPYNLTVNDVMLDSPTNNYPTINSIEPYNSTMTTISQGNLHVAATAYDGYYGNHIATVKVPESGKWYIETRMAVYNGTGNTSWIGVMPQTAAIIPKDGSGATDGEYFTNSAFTGMTADLIATVDTIRLFDGGSVQATVSSATATSYIIALALDVDNNKVYGGYDSGSGITWLDSGNPAAGSNGQSHTFTSETIIQLEVGPKSDGTSNSMQTLNFGQNGTFCGQEIAGGNTDGNGEGNFFYSPPSGFKALCSKNLPTPTIKLPAEHFNTVLYTGNDSTNNITGVGFQPDLVWLKNRSESADHMLHDALRGADNGLRPNTTDVQSDQSANFTGFASDGFSVASSSNRYNDNSENYASWNWKANGSGSSNSEGSVTVTTSANATAGFSMIYHASEGYFGGTYGHGLGKTPAFIITRDVDNVNNWYVWHHSFTNPDYQYLSGLNSYPAVATSSANEYSVGSTTVITDQGLNRKGITYVWAEIEGFSKIGSYTGNGSANGPYIYTGFRPAWMLVKTAASGTAWFLWDNKRDSYNPAGRHSMWASDINGDTDHSSYYVDFLSNGFKLRGTNAGSNNSGTQIFYMAFAASPFKYSNAR